MQVMTIPSRQANRAK